MGVQAAPAGIPDTGIGPAPIGVVPGGVVPVPTPSPSPVPDLAPPASVPSPVAPPAQIGQPARASATSAITFGEQQVRSSLMAQGYTGISGLTMDSAGTWRGTAVRGGSTVSVTIDANGIVTPR